jgi:NAD(P)-dependent dehydrogenase (short-subunit alcohol dehydrogenase family)
VALCSRKEPDLLKVAEEIRALGAGAEIFAADVSRVAEIQTLMRDVLARLGQIDILVDVAGINCRKPSTEITQED